MPLWLWVLLSPLILMFAWDLFRNIKDWIWFHFIRPDPFPEWTRKWNPETDSYEWPRQNDEDER